MTKERYNGDAKRELLEYVELFSKLVNLCFIIQRLAEQESAFKNMSYSEIDRQKWRKVLIADMISSDSSGVEDTIPVLVAKEIPWRSHKVTNFFDKLDNFHEDLKSEQAKRQTKRQIRRGKVSSRGMLDGIPKWAISA